MRHLTFLWSVAATLCLTPAMMWAQSAALPVSVAERLQRAQVPLEAVSVLVTPADGSAPALLSHRTDVPMNPASVTKLITTFAALDLLGPHYTWSTPIWLDGPIRNGVLRGNLIIQGQGDPSLVMERLWLLLRRVQEYGVQRISGDIVLDRRAFEVPATDEAAFDGEPLRPYNASADALLINYKAAVFTFTADRGAGVAHVQMDPPLWDVKVPNSVPLTQGKASTCGDYRSSLRADWSDPARIRFNGNYPAECGEKVWPVAYADPSSYNARAVAGLWRAMGGQLNGKVRDGTAPSTPPSFVMQSPPLSVVIRDINKFSNNVMAQQVFYTLGLTAAVVNDAGAVPVATSESARQLLQKWWQQRIDANSAPVMDNGSGLSRETRISAQQLAQLLRKAYTSPYMPELMSSLPIAGLDGTLRRSQASVASAHLKTGSLKGVLALAGYVHTGNARPLALVALVNHPNAVAARPALDALIDWAAQHTAPPPTAPGQ